MFDYVMIRERKDGYISESYRLASGAAKPINEIVIRAISVLQH
jgi:hypothetical protein